VLSVQALKTHLKVGSILRDSCFLSELCSLETTNGEKELLVREAGLDHAGETVKGMSTDQKEMN